MRIKVIERFFTISTFCADLPAQELSQITMEMGCMVDIEDQIVGIFWNGSFAQFPKTKWLTVDGEVLDDAQRFPDAHCAALFVHFISP